jgi:glutamate dehydrogenase (NAD(P)+)
VLQAVERATGSQFAPDEVARVTHGAGEEDLVNSGLEETMINSYYPIRERWKQQRGKADLRTAAMIVAIDKVALSYAQLGIFP